MNKYNDVRLIGMIGKAGSGKDTLADVIAADGWVKMAFADSLKHLCMDYLGLSYDDAYTQAGKMRMNDDWGMTNRSILQKVGTEAMRNGFDKDVWVKIAMIKVKKLLAEGKKVIVTDCRFDNEAASIESLGGIVVEVVRNADSSLSSNEQQHASEQPVNRKYVAFTVDNNRGIDRLRLAFNNAMGIFVAKGGEFAKLLDSAVPAKQIDEGLAVKSILEIKKFLCIKPDHVHVGNGKIRLEWSGMKEYVFSSLEISDGEIAFAGRSPTKPNYDLSFQFGDVDKWKEANEFIVTKCK